MKRYFAWHKEDPGFESKEACEEWIECQDKSSEWRTVSVNMDKIMEECIENSTKVRIFIAVDAAVKAERERIRGILGL